MAIGPKTTEHDAIDPVPTNVQVAVGVNVTIPVGVVWPVVDMSAIVAVHVVPCPRSIVPGVHVTTVEVG